MATAHTVLPPLGDGDKRASSTSRTATQGPMPPREPRRSSQEPGFRRTARSPVPPLQMTGGSENTKTGTGLLRKHLDNTEKPLPLEDLPTAHRFSQRHELCVEMLVDGYAKSFLEFFRLTEPVAPQVVTDEDEDIQRVQAPKDLSPQQMLVMKQNLTVGEAAERAGDHKTVFQTYVNLASMFEEERNLVEAIKCYEVCLDLGVKSNDAESEGFAHCRLGVSYERLKDVNKAISHYERYHRLSTTKEQTKDACQHLISCYQIMAERCEATGHYDTAVDHLRRCMERAAECDDVESEGTTNYKLGQAYDRIGDPRSAIIYFNNFLDICVRTGNRDGEGMAHNALAVQQQKLGDLPTAIEHLETYISIADATSQKAALCEAACSLGVIYNRQGEYRRAAECFEKNFDTAVRIGDSIAIDSARVQLGVALGQARMAEFMKMVTNGQGDLLKWKGERVADFSR